LNLPKSYVNRSQGCRYLTVLHLVVRDGKVTRWSLATNCCGMKLNAASALFMGSCGSWIK